MTAYAITCPDCYRQFDALPATPAGDAHDMPKGGRACGGRPVLAIGLPWDKPYTANEQRRHSHWASQRRAKAEHQDAAAWAIKAIRHPRIERRVRFALHWRMPDKRLRDPDGLYPSLKAALDAAVVADLLPADDWRYVDQPSTKLHPPQSGAGPAFWIEIQGVSH